MRDEFFVVPVFWVLYSLLSTLVWYLRGQKENLLIVFFIGFLFVLFYLFVLCLVIWMTPKVSAPKSRVKLELLPMYLLESNNNLEVKKYEEEKFVSVEFEPKMRTDVDLDRLDCDDDCDYC